MLPLILLLLKLQLTGMTMKIIDRLLRLHQLAVPVEVRKVSQALKVLKVLLEDKGQSVSQVELDETVEMVKRVLLVIQVKLS